VLHWVDRHDGSPALSILASAGGDRAAATDVLAGILSTEGREQSGIWSTASGVLGAYRSKAALASTEPPYLDADTFCAGPNSLYICAAGRRQQLLAPLVVGLLTDVRDAAYRRAAHQPGGGFPPVLLALDEVANIAPIPDLPAIVTEGAGQGLLTLACLQDLSQGRARWGREAEAFVSLFGTTVVLPGIADMPTLEALSALGGDVEIPTRTVGHALGPSGKILPSVSVSGTMRRRLPVDAIGCGREGQALVVDTRNRMGWVKLTPAHFAEPWAALSRGAERSADRSRSVAEMARHGRGR
ncbi:MAG: type IV secretory system conjugative DNA transfer family protein, partial [Acidimicrobiales bacterium]